MGSGKAWLLNQTRSATAHRIAAAATGRNTAESRAAISGLAQNLRTWHASHPTAGIGGGAWDRKDAGKRLNKPTTGSSWSSCACGRNRESTSGSGLSYCSEIQYRSGRQRPAPPKEHSTGESQALRRERHAKPLWFGAGQEARPARLLTPPGPSCRREAGRILSGTP